jgi:hypothetical protein
MTVRESIQDIYGDEWEDTARDINQGGADAGFSGFIYYDECAKFYDEHEEEIYEMLREDADGMGYSSPDEMIATFNRKDMLQDPTTRKNLLAWYALETVAREVE